MGGLFSKPKPIVMPEVEKEPPEIVSEGIKGEGDRPRRKKGYPETILTGELEPVTTGKTLLG
jgi:hypothetical protein